MRDIAGDFRCRCNTEMVDLEPVASPEDEAELRRLIERHAQFTGSAVARRVLDGWDRMLPKFVKIFPRDYRRVLEATAKARAEGREPTFGELVGTGRG